MNDNNMKKLTRSREHRMICGVCGGLGEYFGVDPTIIRLAVCHIWLHRNRAACLLYCSSSLPNADEF